VGNPNIAVDYETLRLLSTRLNTLRGLLDDMRGPSFDTSTPGGMQAAKGIPTVTYTGHELGPGNSAQSAVRDFYAKWRQSFRTADDYMEKLAKTCEDIARAWFEQDASIAAGANEQALRNTLGMWRGRGDALAQWRELCEKSVSFSYYDESGTLRTDTIPLADRNSPPSLLAQGSIDLGWTDAAGVHHPLVLDMDNAGNPVPTDGSAPRSWHSASPNGGSVNTEFTVDADGNVTSGTTTVTSGDGGFGYSETTTYAYGGDSTTEHRTITDSQGKTSTQSTTYHYDALGNTTSVDGSGTDVEGKDNSSHTTYGPNGGYESTVTKDDGTVTRTTVVVQPDGSAVKTVITGHDPSGGLTGDRDVDVFTGNTRTGVGWTQTSGDADTKTDADTGAPEPGTGPSGNGPPGNKGPWLT